MSPRVNDLHSELNETDVHEIVEVDSPTAVRTALERARREGRPVCVAGGRHAMGGQQFATGGLLLDTRALAGILGFDAERGLIEVEAGIQWPELLTALRGVAGAEPGHWTFAQKQTGADRLSLGGSVSANAHGRALDRPPIVDDVESLVVVGADGEARRASRSENPELFSLAIGGYGLVGVIVSIVLRLVPREVVRRVVEEITLEELMPAFESRLEDGFRYGDFQFATDEASPQYLARGIFSCYRAIDPSTPLPEDQRRLSTADWGQLLELGHRDKARAYDAYVEHYLATSGQVYHSDELQLAGYVDGYHRQLDVITGATERGTEMITEVYVPRDRIVDFMLEAREELRRLEADVIYGTLRLIRRDAESFLPWAHRDYACVIFNLHVVHTPARVERAAVAFRRLIDLVVARGGSYYLTYHRYADRAQVEAAHPRFAAFLERKDHHDPEGLFQSDWYRHQARLFRNG